ncbi:MAG: isoleucine--tRNA ligase, partial [Myxococcales bacterium]|nr:isoleucine--tRNA ligase [Myxococcales bacterium]
TADAGALRTELATNGSVEIVVEGEKIALGPEEIEIAVDAQAGFAAAGGKAGVIVLNIQLDDELRDEGLAREIIAKVQGLRKESGLDFADRIKLHVGGSERVCRVAESQRASLASESLAVNVTVGGAPPANQALKTFSVEGEELALALERA